MMDPRHLFIDERHTGMCVYCGTHPDTRDHVPSKVLLDEPYPPELPVVGACKKCNSSFSLDEQYLACFLDCVIHGGAEASDLHRPNVKRILEGNPALQLRIEGAWKKDEADDLIWEPEAGRVRNVILKLARGHAAYELYPKLEKPSIVGFAPLQILSDDQRSAFEQVAGDDEIDLWPEIGSRAFLRAFGKSPDRLPLSGGWVVVQPGRYRYSVSETGGGDCTNGPERIPGLLRGCMETLNGPLERGEIFATGLRHNLRQAHDSTCDIRFV